MENNKTKKIGRPLEIDLETGRRAKTLSLRVSEKTRGQLVVMARELTGGDVSKLLRSIVNDRLENL